MSTPLGGSGGCNPLGPGGVPIVPPAPLMPLGWSPFGDRFGPMCCYADTSRVPHYLYLYGMTAAVVTATTGSFAKHAIGTTTPPPLPIERTASQFGAATVDPYLMMGRWRLVDIKVVCAGCAVNQAAVGADPRLQIRFYQVNIASNTLFATLDLPCISGLANIGRLDNATGRAGLIYFAQHQFNPKVEPAPFTLCGWQFQNQSVDNNDINSLEVATSALVFKGNF